MADKEEERRKTEALSEIEVTPPLCPQSSPALVGSDFLLTCTHLLSRLRLDTLVLSYLQVLREAQEPSGPLMLSSGEHLYRRGE